MQLSQEISLTGLTAWLPGTRASVSQAVSSGQLDPETAEDLGYSGLPAENELSAPQMAVLAARNALAASGVTPPEVGLLLHAWMYHQGHDLWSPPHYLANELGMPSALPIGVQQVCNGGPAAIELGIARLFAEPSLGHALVTTADRFAEPGFRRWSSDYGIGYGDAATAVLLRPRDERPSDLVLHAITTEAAVQLEHMHRGDDAFSPAPRWHSPHVDMRRTKKAFLTSQGIEAFIKATREKIHRVLLGSLRDASLDAGDPRLRYVVVPRLGHKVLRDVYIPAVTEVTAAEVLNLGTDTGHLGAGDVTANLADLHRRRLLEPGQFALVLNAGAGFTWSSLLVSKD